VFLSVVILCSCLLSFCVPVCCHFVFLSVAVWIYVLLFSPSSLTIVAENNCPLFWQVQRINRPHRNPTLYEFVHDKAVCWSCNLDWPLTVLFLMFRANCLFHIVIRHRNTVQDFTDCETVCRHNINIYSKGRFKPMGLIIIYININMCVYTYIHMYIPRVWVASV